jgi:hypothetical protein
VLLEFHIHHQVHMCVHKPIFILLMAALVPAFTTQGAAAAEPTPRAQMENAAPTRRRQLLGEGLPAGQAFGLSSK